MNDQPSIIDDIGAPLSGDQQAFAIAAATALEAKFNGGKPKPVITNKEVSWHEAVAAEQARTKAQAEGPPGAEERLNILALPRAERVNVAGLSLEHYNLAHSIILEQLCHPIEVGGDVKNADIAVALLVFSNRGLVEALLESHGPESARALVYGKECLGELYPALTRERLTAFTSWMKEEFRLVQKAGGGTSDTGGAAEGGEAKK